MYIKIKGEIMIRNKLTHHLWTRLDDKTTKNVIKESKKLSLTVSAMIRHAVEEYFKNKEK